MPPIFGATGWSALGAALALAGAGVIVLLYLLRRQPERRVVPSTLLWERALREAVARTPWQRLRNQLPLWLEVLAALALALALARPLWPGSAPPLPGGVWVIDASASMHAGDRWSHALQALEADLRRADGGFRGALIWAGPVPAVLAGPDATPGQLREAVAALRQRRPTGAVADWQTALALAYGAAARLPAGSPIRIVTDGSDPGLREQLGGAFPGDRPVELVPVGEPVDNTGILAVAAEDSSATPGGAAPGHPAPVGAAPGGAASGGPSAGGGTSGHGAARGAAAGGPAAAGEAGEGTAGAPAGGPAPAGATTGTAARGGAPPGDTPPGDVGKTAMAPAGVTVTATLAHFGRRPVETNVLLETDGQPREARPVRLEPGEVEQVIWTLDEPARLYRVALAPGDAYPLDDVAWTLARQPERIRIGLLSAGPAGLIERAFRLHPGSQVVRLDQGQAGSGESSESESGAGPASGSGNGNGDGAGSRDGGGTREAGGGGAASEAVAPDLEGFDLLVVVGRPLPPAVPERLPVVWINPPGGAGRELGPAFAPRRLAAGDHPETARVLSHVHLGSFQLMAARPLTLEPGEVPLILGDGRPVAVLRPAGAARAGRAVLAFDPYQGTLLLRPAWPLLVQNLLAVLAPGGFGLPAEATAGESLVMAPSPLLADVTVTDPHGAAVAPGSPLEQPGLYRATARTAGGEPVEAFLWVRPHPGESRAVSTGAGQLAASSGSSGAGAPGDGAVGGQPAGTTGQGQPAGSEAAGAGAGTAGGATGADAGTAGGATGAATAAAAASPYWRIPAFIALLLLILDAWVVRHGL